MNIKEFMDNKRNKIIVIIIFICLIIALTFGIFKIVKINKQINNITGTHDKFENRMPSFDMFKQHVHSSMNDIHTEGVDVSFIHSENISLFFDYQDEVLMMVDSLETIDGDCSSKYNNEKTNSICSTYKEDIEIIVNTFISDINDYNKDIEDYNKKNNTNLELLKFKRINDYVDYNNDGVFSKYDNGKN